MCFSLGPVFRLSKSFLFISNYTHIEECTILIFDNCCASEKGNCRWLQEHVKAFCGLYFCYCLSLVYMSDVTITPLNELDLTLWGMACVCYAHPTQLGQGHWRSRNEHSHSILQELSLTLLPFLNLYLGHVCGSVSLKSTGPIYSRESRVSSGPVGCVCQGTKGAPSQQAQPYQPGPGQTFMIPFNQQLIPIWNDRWFDSASN